MGCQFLQQGMVPTYSALAGGFFTTEATCDSVHMKRLSEMCVLVAQSCLTPCDLVNCSPPGSSVHGILQARILEWVAMPFSRGSSLTQGSNLHHLCWLVRPSIIASRE